MLKDKWLLLKKKKQYKDKLATSLEKTAMLKSTFLQHETLSTLAEL